MFPQEIIRKKRNGEPLTSQEISFFVKGITDGSIADSQTAALTMAIFLNGFNKEETVDLTLSMRDSGDVLKWDLNGPVIDKHSSGGVGDKVSLMLAPILAACGGFVPMISGRGLGHTGGTLDKFDSIEGYNTLPSNEAFVKTVKDVGCAIIGQTGNLAPADKKIYAIRDVCATVESINLITASILSKKLAAGLDYLVMDLKCGNGAFMDNIDNARVLARSIVDVANGAGTKTTALVTNMSEVLGFAVGNALEVKEAVNYLKNQNVNNRLDIVTKELCAELLVSCGLYKDKNDAKAQICKVLSNGEALERFSKMVYMLGGPVDFVNNPDDYMPQAKIIKPVFADKEGYVSSMKTRDIGMLIVGLKGGRVHPDQKLDYATGFDCFCQVGDYVDNKTPLAYIHAQTEEDYEKTANELKKLIVVEDAFEPRPVILDLIK
ncbi:MAG: thymidine phosphorylase [Alphaproteobacteria bacterium]|nr:thymidine phosphorylase [Alphaproteobacteria bacterium]